WIVITAGWAFGVFIGVNVAMAFGSPGAHINPAVTLALAVAGKFPWQSVPWFMAAQCVGGFLGAMVVWLAYYPHWIHTVEKDAKLAVFCTGPAVRSYPWNFITEVVGTMVLVIGIAALGWRTPVAGLGPFLVGALVWGIGLSLGGPTGYAINPARDLGPRLAHQILPVAGKGGSDWSYGWVPVAAPLAGAVVSGLLMIAAGM
ncbi:MAG: aquaporin family protein, partial [Spirochaetes bacterium]|nr:aquaporin family protein [Spirochaetota bacterium]